MLCFYLSVRRGGAVWAKIFRGDRGHEAQMQRTEGRSQRFAPQVVTAVYAGPSALLLVFALDFELSQPFFPFGGFVGLARAFVELHQTLHGLF